MLLDEQQTPQIIFDVTTQDFEQSVIAASMQVPVIVDFWAPWCEPCKQLMPALEKVVTAAGGKVLLAKVNIDESQDLAAALRVQSVPTVYGFFQGKPLDAFQGVQPESKLREFVQNLITAANAAQPDALDIPETLKQAAVLLSEGNAQSAHQLYSAVISQDAQNADAYVGMVRCFIEIGQIEQAQTLIEKAPEEIAKAPIFAEARTALDLAQKASEVVGRVKELAEKITANEKDHAARIDLAYALYAQGKKKEATEALLESIALDASWNEGLARTELLTLFSAMGASDPVAITARRKLSSLLFS